MNNYRFKIFGIIISITGLIAMIVEALSSFILFPHLDSHGHFNLFNCILLLGMFIIIFSKEKFEDERVKQIRAKSFQIAFTLTISIILSVAFSGIFGNVHFTSDDLLAIADVSCVFYILYYYVNRNRR